VHRLDGGKKDDDSAEYSAKFSEGEVGEAGGEQHQQDATASAVAIVDSDESYSNKMHV
jgi:hypothetical protein